MATVTAYYRTFDLQWDVPAEEQSRLRRIMAACVGTALVLCVLMPLLPLPERGLNVPPPVPPRIAKLVLERELPPPPVEVVPETMPEPEAVKAKPATRPDQRPGEDLARTQSARKRASQAGLLPFTDELADLRDKFEVTDDQLAPSANTAAVDEGTPRAERSLITSKAGSQSGGINTSAVSRGFGYGTGSVGGHGTTQMVVPFGGSGGGKALKAGPGGSGDGVTRSGAASGKPARSREEIELVFDRNKAAIYSIYNRALRDNPALQGKVVLQLTIQPSGEVTDVRIVSSELGDAELERKLLARIRLFRFADKDVEAITTTKPIEFFPS
ncbi:MAG: TonB family protein [Steroidobacteraceae bacterium]|nr:TonB family protein [Steroidobacteraceae bacterium]